MKNRFRFLILCLFFPLSILAQNYEGTVLGEGEALEGVSIVLLGGENQHKILSFTQSNEQGRFSLPINKEGSVLLFTYMGYAKHSISTSHFKNGQIIRLKEHSLQIKEVIIKAPSIRTKGDTLTYSVGAFKQKQDKNILDIIKRMPGLSVDKDGTINYQGRRINKFYIEGMDLLGAKYNQASSNLSADKVKSVQVYENHQAVKLYRNRTFSEQAALNIVLKDDAKNVWQGVADLSLGRSLQGAEKILSDSRLMEMLFAKNRQSISIYKFNNIGDNIKKEVDVARLFGFQAPLENRVSDDFSMTAPDLKEERTSFNNTHILASNWLFKTKKMNDIRFQISGLFDKNSYAQYKQIDYLNMKGNAHITDNYEALVRKQKISTELMYKINNDDLYFVNTIRCGLDNSKSLGTSILNTKSIELYSKPKKTYFADDIEVIKRLKNGKNISLRAYLSHTNISEDLRLADKKTESLDMNATYWGASSFYGHQLGSINLKYNLEVKGYRKNIGINIDRQESTFDYINNKLIFAPELYYNNKQLSWNILIPISLLTQKANTLRRNHFLFEPKLSVNYKPNAHWDINTSYIYTQTELNGLQTYNRPIYTSYNLIQVGNSNLDFNRLHNLNANLMYRDTHLGFFSSLNLSYVYQPNNYLYKTSLNDDFIVQELSNSQGDRQGLMMILRVSKSFGSKLTTNFTAYLNRQNYHYLLAEEIVPSRMQNTNLSISLSYRPFKWFSINEKSYLFMTKQWRTDSDNHMRKTCTFSHEFNLNFSYKDFVISSNNDLYHSNDGSSSFNFFSDMKMTYQHKQSEYSFMLNNLFGTSEYRREIISSNIAMISVNKVRPREIIFKYSFNF